MVNKIIDKIYWLTYKEAVEKNVLLRNNLPSGFYAKSINYPNTVDLITYLKEHGVVWNEQEKEWTYTGYYTNEQNEIVKEEA